MVLIGYLSHLYHPNEFVDKFSTWSDRPWRGYPPSKIEWVCTSLCTWSGRSWNARLAVWLIQAWRSVELMCDWTFGWAGPDVFFRELGTIDTDPDTCPDRKGAPRLVNGYYILLLFWNNCHLWVISKRKHMSTVYYHLMSYLSQFFKTQVMRNNKYVNLHNSATMFLR
jgi:hypothetical protein